MDEYNLVIKYDGNVYMMKCKGMHDLKEYGILAFTNILKTWHHMATSQWNTPPAYGATTQEKQLSPSA